MKLLQSVLPLLSILLLSSCHLQGYDTVSPDGCLKVIVSEAKDNSFGPISFSVEYQGKQILPNVQLGLETNLQKHANNLKIKFVSDRRTVIDDYKMVTGKKSHCMNKSSERIYTFENDKGQTLLVTFRVYNDGVAFKYGLHTIADEEHVTNELTTYAIPQGSKRWMQQYDLSYERFFPLSADGTSTDNPTAGYWGYPALVEPCDSLFILITEANIQRGHCGSSLYNGKDYDRYQVHLVDKKVTLSNSWSSPWRLLIIGSLNNIVESTLVTDVSEPCRIKDTDWIVPGSAAWIYWAYNHSSKDFKIVKEYIDLASEMKWPYDLIDWEWDVMQNGGNIQDAIKYASEKGVKLFLWYNSSTSWIGQHAPGPLFRLNDKESRKKEFQWLNEMGIAGIKVDFFAGDSVAAMNYYIDLLEDAAKYKLMLNFHGATIPRGWQRTYPNMMSVEGVYGAEWYNNNPVLTNKAAAHNATLPFTRNVVGSMDYTPGTFSDSQHLHITTYGHELALPIIFESALQHMPDRPSAYYSLPKQVKEFLSLLPTAWDDTKLLSGYPGVDVVIARRKNNVWYIGGINGTDKQKVLHFPLDTLIDFKGRKATIIKDGIDDRSFEIKENIQLSDNDATMTINCLPRGGFVMVIE